MVTSLFPAPSDQKPTVLKEASRPLQKDEDT